MGLAGLKDPTSPVIVDVSPGIRLVFPYTKIPHQQSLQLIAIQLDSNCTPERSKEGAATTTNTLRKAMYPGALKLMYDDKHLATINSPSGRQPEKGQLTRSRVTQVFGTTFSRRSHASSDSSSKASSSSNRTAQRASPLLAREAEIRYPGVVFQLNAMVHGVESVNAVIVVPPGREDSIRAGRVLEVLDGTVKEDEDTGTIWDAFMTASGEEVRLHGTIASCEIRVSHICPTTVSVNVALSHSFKPRHGILLQINNQRSNGNSTTSLTTPYEVEMWKTTGQDLLCDLGPPGRKYWKDDDRFADGYTARSPGPVSDGRAKGMQEEHRSDSRGCKFASYIPISPASRSRCAMHALTCCVLFEQVGGITSTLV